MEEIIEKLNLLRKLDQEFSVFGSSSHQYELNETLSDDQLAAIEKKYNCHFPSDYKEFITKVGDGGAGPFYGLFPVEIQDDDHDYCSWEEGYLIGDLSKPFKHTDSWNQVPSFWEKKPNLDENTPEEKEEQWNALLEKNYFNEEVMQGAIPICHQGCAIRNWLVVTGQASGTVWIDYRTDYKGIEPLMSKEKNKISFSEWYLMWLHESILNEKVTRKPYMFY
jgi:hypothetical protein